MTDSVLVPSRTQKPDADLPEPTEVPAVQRAAAMVAVELDRIQQAARNVDQIESDHEMITVWLRRQIS